MSNRPATTRSTSARRVADPTPLQMTWALEVGPGRGLVARWDTTDERRQRIDVQHRNAAA